MSRNPYTLKIAFPHDDWPFGPPSDVEEPLDEELMGTGVGEVTGGSVGKRLLTIRLEVANLDEGLSHVRKVLRKLQVPRSTWIESVGPEVARYPVYDED